MTYGDMSYTWEHGRELSSLSDGTTTWTYTYDANGMRTSRSNGTTTFSYVYNGSKLTQMTVGNNVLYFIYAINGAPAALKYGSAYYCYVTNLQGDVIAIMSSAGAMVVSYEYDAWGNIVSIGGTMASTLGVLNPLTYRGYVYDHETGLYYLQSRYYNPTWGRFLNADVLVATGQGMLGNNMFAYCRNNPVKRKDATGTEDLCVTTNEDDGNPLNDFGPVTGGGGGAGGGGYVYGVDFSVATYSSLYTGGIYNTGYASYGYSTAPNSTPSNSAPPVSACFIAGTLVQAEDGAVPIEDITAGDKVWAWDESTGEVALKEVVETYVNKTTELVHVFVNGEEIITTPTHPFYSPVKGWTAAAKLRAGDILVLLNGEYVVVEKVQHEILETPITVYNFQVEGYHTYYVSNLSVLVHNSCNHNSKWDKERSNHWKDTAKTAVEGKDYGAYIATPDNIARMQRGLAPIGWDGYSVHLHHWNGIANDFYNYSALSRTLHQLVHRFQ